MEVWDHFFEIVQENDPYDHLRSIHNGNVAMNYDHTKPWGRTAGGGCGNYRLIYFGEQQPKRFGNGLPEEGRYEADVIDTWEMTVETLGTFEGQEPIELPGRPGLALRIRPVEG